VEEFDKFTHSFLVTNRLPALIRRRPNEDWQVNMSTVRAGIDESVYILILLVMIAIFMLHMLAAKVHGHKLQPWMYIAQMIPNWQADRCWPCVGVLSRSEVGSSRLT
jgi:hypothetical protein